MALELVKLDSGTLPAIANAIREKTGDTALLLPSQMAGAIAGISSGVELPALTTPAKDSDVLNGKEYIGAAGEKRTGTLVVCDTVGEVETIANAGVGLKVNIGSTADLSSATLNLTEPNLKSENIKSGISIFNVAGSVKEIRTETGTITPAEDTKSITIPCSDGAKAFILEATDDVLIAVEGQSLSYAVAFAGNFMPKHNIENASNTAMTVWYKTRYANGGIKAQNSGGVTLSLDYNFYPGTYRWVAYYWEDAA